DTLNDTLAILEGGSGVVPDDPAVMDAITTTRDIAELNGVTLPGPVDVSTPTPAPTDPAAEPTDAPAEPTPAPTSNGHPTATPTATTAPAPTATADNRAPPAFLP
ncbi:MAG TPA: calcium-binding protein, partial [Dehalococcoidia bacterium]